jgi:hypothetical protein
VKADNGAGSWNAAVAGVGGVCSAPSIVTIVIAVNVVSCCDDGDVAM